MADEPTQEQKKAPEETAQPEAKKKRGKLPVIIALALILAGGGYFFMGSGKKKPSARKTAVIAPKLGTIEPIKEFLVNLDGGTSYLKAEISLHLVKDFDKAKLEEAKPAIQDAIILRLRAKKLSDIRSLDQLRDLKREIAADVNEVLLSESPAKRPGAGALAKVPDDFDSPTGPVLKVYFTSFATQ
ncbi:MAG: flagellar basal body-associated FliL family protein [Fimbriimonas ginsengisoli]|uniref:Flagellar protein FliL n=1 Tax=Fimbriimonas ginsengisoli TaxID=1005039 RepID=A0A931PTX9_FIMGI|nr:flagellar basal body-associated FliL family protein [Fimbriimonas ginsengisoli]